MICMYAKLTTQNSNVLLVTILNHRIFCSIQHSHVFSFGVGLKSSPPLFWDLKPTGDDDERGAWKPPGETFHPVTLGEI